MAKQHVRIGDCAEVLPGYSVKGRVEHDPRGRYQIIQGKHLTEGVPYRYQEQDKLRIDTDRPVENYLVQVGDVLFASRGLSNYAVCLEDVPESTIAPATFYILRPKQGTDAHYLAWCLNQAPVQAAIAQTRTGAATPIIQRNALADVSIPLPLIEEQQRIARLAELMGRERQLLQQLQHETERYHNLLGRKILAKAPDQ
ncbi:MAG: restriction endonuclease subunit S [Candidatus Thiodiazotropha sp. (ex. Lucinisca nassula)]|nr:restriction endonuclease subunit S [Candidatus Thiodiazotropha sp. (ex. Lucinisca nassula)]MBW9273068.1 restriction endonuclease subunit S [Candidatus Thiodiazotropha sp. (ex. Lucinisca nassula)]